MVERVVSEVKWDLVLGVSAKWVPDVDGEEKFGVQFQTRLSDHVLLRVGERFLDLLRISHGCCDQFCCV